MSAGTRPFRPSNGTGGEIFMARWCFMCEREEASRLGKGDGCDILTATLLYDIRDPDYPPEWVEDDVAGPRCNPRCTAFVPIGSEIPIEDDRQLELSFHAG